MSEQRLLSADSHVWEPPGLWEERIEPAFRERAPHLARGPEGDRWVAEGVALTPLGSSQRRETPGEAPERRPATKPEPPRFEDVIRKGAYDPHARQADMELDGVSGEIVYPTVALEMFPMPD